MFVICMDKTSHYSPLHSALTSAELPLDAAEPGKLAKLKRD